MTSFLLVLPCDYSLNETFLSLFVVWFRIRKSILAVINVAAFGCCTKVVVVVLLLLSATKSAVDGWDKF